MLLFLKGGFLYCIMPPDPLQEIVKFNFFLTYPLTNGRKCVIIYKHFEVRLLKRSHGVVP